MLQAVVSLNLMKLVNNTARFSVAKNYTQPSLLLKIVLPELGYIPVGGSGGCPGY